MARSCLFRQVKPPFSVVSPQAIAWPLSDGDFPSLKSDTFTPQISRNLFKNLSKYPVAQSLRENFLFVRRSKCLKENFRNSSGGMATSGICLDDIGILFLIIFPCLPFPILDTPIVSLHVPMSYNRARRLILRSDASCFFPGVFGMREPLQIERRKSTVYFHHVVKVRYGVLGKIG